MLGKRFFLFILFPLLSWSQDFSSLWEGHFSYLNITQIVSGEENQIYAASDNAVFSFNTATQEFIKIDTVSGLSGNSITTIFYSNQFQLLIIGYDDGLIEIVFNDGTDVLSVVDIIEKVSITSANKRINHFEIQNNLLYIATGFGISVFNLERLEFGDTFFIGDLGTQINVAQTTIVNQFIYAACNNQGLRKANLNNTNLIDFQNWQVVDNRNMSFVESINNNLYAITADRILFEVQNDVLTERLRFNASVREFSSTAQQIAVVTNNAVFYYNDNFSLQLQIDEVANFETEFTSTFTTPQNIFIGTTGFGVLKTEFTNPVSFEELHPDGPLLNIPFAVESNFNEVWVTYGEYDAALNPFPVNNRGISRLKNQEWENTPSSALFNAVNLNSVTFNPFLPTQVFISSFFSGLLEINNGEPTILLNSQNSGLEPIVLPNSPNSTDTRVGPTVFDEEGLLWTVTSVVKSPLKSYNPTNGNWNSFSFESIIPNEFNNLGFEDIAIGGGDNIWVASSNFGVIGFNQNSGRPLLKALGEEENLPSNFVRSLAIDRRNQLWIGTSRGLRVLFNTLNFFEDENVSADEIIIEENGIAQELLFQQFISKIIVDSSNNKWIGTFGSGLFLLSSDGQQTIFHFTKENSPLPSNNISDLSLNNTNGTLYIATQQGLVSYKTGGTSITEDFRNSNAFPNPVRPGFDIVGDKVKIRGLPENVNIKITDVEGNLVAEAQSRINQRFNNFNLEIDGGIAFWNGKNLANSIVASGVYLILLADLDSLETNVIKLMVVR